MGQFLNRFDQSGICGETGGHDDLPNLLIGIRIGKASLGAVDGAPQFLLRRWCFQPFIEPFGAGTFSVIQKRVCDYTDDVIAHDLLRVVLQHPNSNPERELWDFSHVPRIMPNEQRSNVWSPSTGGFERVTSAGNSKPVPAGGPQKSISKTSGVRRVEGCQEERRKCRSWRAADLRQ